MTLTERFWARVDQSGDCWVWTRARSAAGYGQMSVDGRVEYAHRIAWRLTEGLIPPGFHVLHRCDNPPCVRPVHLFLGTNNDNVADMVQKRRNRVPHPSAGGSSNHQAKLDLDTVEVIRRLYAAGDATEEKLAARFAVHQTTIGRIVRGVTWK